MQFSGGVRRFVRGASSVRRVLVVLASVAACASPPRVNAFTEFEKSVLAVRDGVRAQSSELVSDAGKRSLRTSVDSLDESVRTASDSAASPDDRKAAQEAAKEIVDGLVLTWTPTDPLGVNGGDALLPLQLERFRDGINRVHDAAAGYAGLLSNLAAAPVEGDQQFASDVERLNSSAAGAITALGGKVPDPRDAAIVSVGAMQVFKEYLMRRKAADLRRAIDQNQETVRQFVNSARTGVGAMAIACGNEYLAAADDFRVELRRKDADAKARLAGAESLLELDRRFMARLESLRRIDGALEAIPAAHSDLAGAAESDASPIDRIQALRERGDWLVDLYEQQRGRNEVRTARAKAAEAASNAADADAEATQAEDESTRASKAAKSARAEADASPGDADKKKRAERLEADAAKAVELAERLRKKADKAQAAADAAKDAADALEKAATPAGGK